MEYLVLGALVGLIPAVIAQRKGYSFVGWWIFGALLFIVALPMALVMKPNQSARRQCPHCRAWIDREATVCRQCSRDVPPAEPVEEPYARRPWERDT
jgi:hypothetical protein